MSGSSQQATTQNTSSTSDVKPWEPQKQELLKAFGYADSAYNKASGAQGPTDFVSQFTPDQLATFNKMIGYSGDPTATAGNNLSVAGSNAAAGGLGALAGFNPADPTQQNIANATAYANNPAVDGMIDSAMRDARRSVSEQVLPGIAQNAALTGNTNNSRRALAEGVVERGLADATADTSANIRGQMFQNGLNLAQSDNQFNTSAVLDAMKARVSGGNEAAVAGAGTAGQAVQNQGALFDINNQGGAGQQAAGQANLDNQLAQYQFNTTSPFDALNQYYGIIGANNWGGKTNSTGTGTSVQTSTPSAWQVAGGMMGAAGSLLKSDRRFKTDIAPVGSLSDGQIVYRYRYKDSPVYHIGLMAQEVEQVTPEAVEEIRGVKHVDYKLATDHLV